MANRREEERERLRQARKEREVAHASRSNGACSSPTASPALIGLLVVAGIVAVDRLARAAAAARAAHINQASRLDQRRSSPTSASGTEPPPAAGRTTSRKPPKAGRLRAAPEAQRRGQHPPPARQRPTPDYKTNPPTSGNHVEPPYQQADGAYSEMPDEIYIVHSLEHGRMEIQYSPDLPEEDQLELKGLYDTMYGGTLLFPNDEHGPTRSRRPPGPTCSAAPSTKARSPSTRSAPSAKRPGAATAASR